jgi:hypothetical protein
MTARHTGNTRSVESLSGGYGVDWRIQSVTGNIKKKGKDRMRLVIVLNIIWQSHDLIGALSARREVIT